MDDAQLHTVWQQRQMPEPAVPLGRSLTTLMKYDLARRVRRIGQLADIWDDVIPAGLREHTALDGFSRGVLRVAVDSAAHRYQLRMLLDGGLRREIQARFGGALDKIRLIPGQFEALELP
ncbi:MAG: DciA family protein [Planctomycetota bacterium]